MFVVVKKGLKTDGGRLLEVTGCPLGGRRSGFTVSTEHQHSTAASKSEIRGAGLYGNINFPARKCPEVVKVLESVRQ